MLHSCWMEGAKRHASAGSEVALVIIKVIVRGLSRFIARNRSSLKVPPGLLLDVKIASATNL